MTKTNFGEVNEETLTEYVEEHGGHPDAGGVGGVLDLAGERLAEVVLGELVPERVGAAPAPLVARLRRVALLALQLPVAQVPAQPRRGVALPALARQRLHLGRGRRTDKVSK